MMHDVKFSGGPVVALDLRQHVHMKIAAGGALEIAEDIEAHGRRGISKSLIRVGRQRLAQARDKRGQQKSAKLHIFYSTSPERAGSGSASICHSDGFRS